MATARLDVRTKERITNTISEIINRIHWYPDPPLKELTADSAKEFLEECTNPISRQAVQMLREQGEKDFLYRAETYEPCVRTAIPINKPDGTMVVAGLGFGFRYLALEYRLPNYYHQEWQEWVDEKRGNQGKAAWANSFIESVVKDCTSVGQLLRAMPFMRTYLPDSMVRSLGEAKRMSRMPQVLAEMSYADRHNSMKQLEEILAVAYLLKERTYIERAAFPIIRELTP